MTTSHAYPRRAAGSASPQRLARRSASAGATSSRWSAAMAAFGGARLRRRGRRRPRRPSPAPGEKLAKEQMFRYGGGGWCQNDPSSHDFNKDLYCSRRARALRRAHGVQRRLRRGAVDGEQGRVATRTARCGPSPSGRTPSGRTARPCTARDFEWSWKRQLDPASAAPYASLPLRHQERRGVQQEAGHGRRARSASRAKDDWTLEVTLEGPRGYFPVLAAYLAALPGAPARRWRSTATSGRRPGNIVSNGAVHAGGVGAQQADGAQEEPALLRRQGRAPRAR